MGEVKSERFFSKASFFFPSGISIRAPAVEITSERILYCEYDRDAIRTGGLYVEDKVMVRYEKKKKGMEEIFIPQFSFAYQHEVQCKGCDRIMTQTAWTVPYKLSLHYAAMSATQNLSG